MTLLGLLAGGRGPIPALSAIAGVVSRVGSEAGAAGVCGGQFGGQSGGDGPVACAA